MKTLGVDLASQPRQTATCEIVWTGDGAIAQTPTIGRTDDELVGEIESADVVGIDAPFGFPEPFADAVAAWRAHGAWPDTGLRDLRFRRTDLQVRELTGKWPLSVSSDLIALPAWRCARLLTRLGVAARDGTEEVAETYPGAALSMWRFERAGYKASADTRTLLVEALCERAAEWLEIADRVRLACVASDHALDALIAALVARAVALGLTITPPAELREAARIEGWIHLPTSGSLERLPGHG